MASKNYNTPANPVPSQNFAGLTKLEAFTMAAMQGLCAKTYSPNFNEYIEIIARQAVFMAKSTLDELEKPEGGENEQA